ncbi:MAG TPA: phosphotransferase [Gaiellales bacterium]|nr:phosphotransferase [Gaiellales bacterium]
MQPPLTRHAVVRADRLSPLQAPPAWLAAIADPDQVAQALRRRVPGVIACRLERIRIKQGGCGAIYHAELADPSAPAREITLRGDVVDPSSEPFEDMQIGEIGAPDWRCSLPELRLQLRSQSSDGGLPSMSRLLDAELARQLIEDTLGASDAFAGFAVAACRPHVTRYKAGSRCTVVYELDLAPGSPAHWPRLLVAKTHHGDKGQVAWQAMRALWDSPLRRSSAVSIAEPLAYLPDGPVLLQRGIRHRQTLKDRIRLRFCEQADDRDDGLDDLLHRVGRGLAELHASGVCPEHERTLGDELDEVGEVIGRLAWLVPSLEDTRDALIADLKRVATGTPAQPAVPAHGSFRPAQVVIGEADAIGFIDFDSFCRADAALDVSLFCSGLRDTGLRASGAADRGDPDGLDATLAGLDQACDAFISGYQQHRPIDRDVVALWDTVNAITGVLHCWTKVKFDRLPYRMALLRQRLGGSNI